jgi:hypothetical protein
MEGSAEPAYCPPGRELHGSFTETGSNLRRSPAYFRTARDDENRARDISAQDSGLNGPFTESNRLHVNRCFVARPDTDSNCFQGCGRLTIATLVAEGGTVRIGEGRDHAGRHENESLRVELQPRSGTTGGAVT